MTSPYSTISSWFEDHGDFEENLVEPTVDEPVCEACGDPNPARTKNDKGVLLCEPCIDDEIEEQERAAALEDYEPCCYASTMHFGTGDHEWGCPNY